jgi:acetolactate synthase-1/2/3 large subunit
MTGKTVAQTIVETLRDLGVRHIFSVPSGGWVDNASAGCGAQLALCKV